MNASDEASPPANDDNPLIGFFPVKLMALKSHFWENPKSTMTGTSACESMMLVGLRSLWAVIEDWGKFGSLLQRGNPLTNSFLVKISKSTGKLAEVRLGSYFRDSDRHELGEERHYNPAVSVKMSVSAYAHLSKSKSLQLTKHS